MTTIGTHFVLLSHALDSRYNNCEPPGKVTEKWKEINEDIHTETTLVIAMINLSSSTFTI
jgi:hypothetical protein